MNVTKDRLQTAVLLCWPTWPGGVDHAKKNVPHLEEVTNLGDLSLCKCASHEVAGKVNENHKC